MATIKYIIKNQSKKNGKHPVYLQLIHNRKTTTIKTGIDVFKDEWHHETCKIKKIKKGSQNIGKLNSKLNRFHVEITELIEEFEKNKTLNLLSVTELRAKLLGIEKSKTLFKYWENYINCTNNFKSESTRESHINTLKSFKKYRNNKDISFSNINKSFLTKYVKWNSSKSIPVDSQYKLKYLKYIINDAIDDEVIDRDKSPFNNYKIKSTVTPRKKRTLSYENFELIESANLTSPKMIEAKELFLISFYLGGVAFVDLCRLKYENIQDDYINFKRSKTKVECRNKINPKLNVLLKKYLKPNFSKTDLIFNFIKTDDINKHHRVYKNALRRYNYALKELSKKCNLNIKLSSYYSRHGFASICINELELPLSYVKIAMGHKHFSTTEKYIDTISKELLTKYANKL